jgi:hypothetical protein
MLAPSSRVFSTIRIFSAAGQRRRRPPSVRSQNQIQTRVLDVTEN